MSRVTPSRPALAAPPDTHPLWPHFYGLIAPAPRPTLARIARWQREQLALTRLAWQAPPPVLQAARTVATAAAARLAVDPVAASAVTLVWGVDPWHVAETLGLTRDIERARTLRRFLALTRTRVLLDNGPSEPYQSTRRFP